MIADLVLEDDDSGPKTSPGLYTYPPIPAAELLGVERVFRFASSAARVILFIYLPIVFTEPSSVFSRIS